MRIYTLLPLLITLVAGVLWYSDGGWEHGALSTKGMGRVTLFAAFSVIFFLLAQRLNKK